jgi:hypothetical protein
MDLKPFPIHVGSDRRVTHYDQHSIRGKVPSPEVMNWLAEVGIQWQFEWHSPAAVDYQLSAVEMMEYVKLVDKNAAKSGGTFYFDNEEDRLLFCLTWVANGIKQDTAMWHPV